MYKYAACLQYYYVLRIPLLRSSTNPLARLLSTNPLIPMAFRAIDHSAILFDFHIIYFDFILFDFLIFVINSR